jgi:hypothetical protein
LGNAVLAGDKAIVFTSGPFHPKLGYSDAGTKTVGVPDPASLAGPGSL